MSDTEYARKLDEVDSLINDPTRRLDADKVWSLLAELAGHRDAGDRQASRT